MTVITLADLASLTSGTGWDPEFLAAVDGALASNGFAVPAEEALQIIDAAKPLWDALGAKVDGFGGSEFMRVFPAVLRLINHLANGAPL